MRNSVAVAFAHKAAGDLKLRLRQELDRGRSEAQGDEIARLEAALEHLEEAAIGTIHSFCGQILRERPVEARVDPGFAEISEQDAEGLYQASFQRWLERKLGESAPGLKRALSRLAWREDTDSGAPLDAPAFAGRKLGELRGLPTPPPA